MIALREELADKRSRLASLLEIARNYDGFDRGVRAVMLKAGAQAREMGIFGLVADVISATPRFEKAIEAALGERLQHVVVENREKGLELVEYLKSDAEGRSTFVPVERRRGGARRRCHRSGGDARRAGPRHRRGAVRGHAAAGGPGPARRRGHGGRTSARRGRSRGRPGRPHPGHAGRRGAPGRTASSPAVPWKARRSARCRRSARSASSSRRWCGSRALQRDPHPPLRSAEADRPHRRRAQGAVEEPARRRAEPGHPGEGPAPGGRGPGAAARAARGAGVGGGAAAPVRQRAGVGGGGFARRGRPRPDREGGARRRRAADGGRAGGPAQPGRGALRGAHHPAGEGRREQRARRVGAEGAGADPGPGAGAHRSGRPAGGDAAGDASGSTARHREIAATEAGRAERAPTWPRRAPRSRRVAVRTSSPRLEVRDQDVQLPRPPARLDELTQGLSEIALRGARAGAGARPPRRAGPRTPPGGAGAGAAPLPPAPAASARSGAQLKELRGQVERMGEINLTAIDEHKELLDALRVPLRAEDGPRGVAGAAQGRHRQDQQDEPRALRPDLRGRQREVPAGLPAPVRRRPRRPGAHRRGPGHASRASRSSPSRRARSCRA